MADAEVAAAADPRPSRRSGAAVRWMAIGALAAVIAGGAWWWMHHDRESTDDAQIDGSIVPVAAKVGGIVRDVPVHENQTV